MIVDEASRNDLYAGLAEVIGSERAATLMGHLPPVPWSDLATKADLEDLRVATKADIDSLRAATKADIESLRVATKADIDSLRVDIDSLRAATKADIELSAKSLELSITKMLLEQGRSMVSQTRMILFTIVTTMVVLAGFFGAVN